MARLGFYQLPRLVHAIITIGSKTPSYSREERKTFGYCGTRTRVGEQSQLELYPLHHVLSGPTMHFSICHLNFRPIPSYGKLAS